MTWALDPKLLSAPAGDPVLTVLAAAGDAVGATDSVVAASAFGAVVNTVDTVIESLTDVAEHSPHAVDNWQEAKSAAAAAQTAALTLVERFFGARVRTASETGLGDRLLAGSRIDR